jgi:hypothetical protein
MPASFLFGRKNISLEYTFIFPLVFFFSSMGPAWRSVTTLGARVVQSVQCLTANWTTGFPSPAEALDFSSSPCVQTSSGVHPASYPMGTGGPFPGGKARPGRDTDHKPLFSAEVKNEQELYFSHPWSLHGVAGQIYFLYISLQHTKYVTFIYHLK